MKTDLDKITADLLADASFRGLCDAEIIPTADDTTGEARTVGRLLHLDSIQTVHRRQVTNRTFEDWRGRDAAAGQLRRLPAQGATIHAITDGSYRGVDLIPAMLDMGGAVASELIISTLSFSKDNISTLAQLLDEKRIRRAALICSIYFARTSADAYEHAVDELTRRKVPVVAARCHAKIVLLRTDHGEHYIIEGSANLRSCLCIEQISLTNDPALYKFHHRWLRHVIKETYRQ